MAGTDALLGDIETARLAAGYVFYGEEDYLAEEAIRSLKESLISPDFQSFNVERFDLAATSWVEIIDTARTAPFFFSPWRIVVVQVVEKNTPGKEGKEDRNFARLSSLDEKIVREYFESPSEKTVLIVVIKGRVRKTHPLVKLFNSLPRSAVVLKEIKPLKQGPLQAWMRRRLEVLGKSATPEALRRLQEVAGNDLRLIDRELEKIVTYAADRKTIDVEDVNQVCAWTKGYIEWDLAEALKAGDQIQALSTLNCAFRESEKPENIMRVLANFFRDILLAKLWLSEGRSRKEIFAFLKPQIQEAWDLYAREFQALFSVVDRMPLEEVKWAIQGLETIDLSIKTTGASPEPLIERFVVDCCRRLQRPREWKNVIWRKGG